MITYTNDSKGIFDVANKLLGGFDNIYASILMNNGLSINDDITLKTLYVDDTYKDFTPKDLTTKNTTNTNKYNITTYDGQSIYDVALQYTNNLDTIVSILKDNNLGIDDYYMGLRTLVMNKNLIQDMNTYKYNMKNNIIYNTSPFQYVIEYGYILMEDDGNVLSEDTYPIYMEG